MKRFLIPAMVLLSIIFIVPSVNAETNDTFVGPVLPKYTTIYNLKEQLRNKDYKYLVYGKYSEIQKDRVKMIPGKHEHAFIVDLSGVTEFTPEHEIYIVMEPKYTNKCKFVGDIDIAQCGVSWTKSINKRDTVQEKVSFVTDPITNIRMARFESVKNKSVTKDTPCRGDAKIAITVRPGSDVFEIQELVVTERPKQTN